MDRYFDSHECCKLIDDIDDYTESKKMGKENPKMLKDMAERVILMQKETIRMDKEMGDSVFDELDTVEDIENYIENDTHKFKIYVELRGMDFFDYERAREMVG